MSEPKGLITNLEVVKSALRGKSKNNEPQTKKKPPKAKPKKPKDSAKGTKPDNNNININKKEKANGVPSENASGALPSSSPLDSTEELKRALFPDLYPSSNPKGNSSNSNSTRSSANGTHKKGSRSNNGNGNGPSTPQKITSNAFAGSSFHSSPAASSLPKPSFNTLKARVNATSPAVSLSSSASPAASPSVSNPVSNSVSESPGGGLSMFDQFMMADRAEKASRKQ